MLGYIVIFEAHVILRKQENMLNMLIFFKNYDMVLGSGRVESVTS